MPSEIRVAFAIALSCLLLAGCSSGPSDADMKAALLTQFAAVAGKDAEIVGFEANDCRESEGTHACRIKARLLYTIRFGDRDQEREQPLVGTYRFTERDGEWRLMQ